MGTQSTTQPRRSTLTLLCAALTLLGAITSRAQIGIQTSATALPLNRPSIIVFGPTGNLYLAETGNHLIRKVDAQGHITTIAGTGTQGFSGDSGPATAAQLDSPQGLALTPTALYIADTHNHRIRKLDLATNLLTTIAGSTPGFSGDSGPATAAQLNLPTALTLDASQNLYIADTYNHRIRRIDATTGLITTIAGNGTQGYSGDHSLAIAASIDSPTGLALDASQNIYIADTHNHRIRRIDATTSIITTLAGTGTPSFSGDNAASTAATLALPTGLTLDTSGNLFFADTANHRLRRIDATTGTITTAVGNGTQAFAGDTLPATTASLDSPRAATLSPAGLLTLSDTANQRVRQRAADSTINTIAGVATTPKTRAPVSINLTITAAINPSIGSPITLTAQIVPTSPGLPNGTITFLDASSPFAALPIAPNGTASLTISNFPVGPHILTAFYSGDANFFSATSIPTLITIAAIPMVSPDFSLAPTGATSQVITSGTPANFTFAVKPQGTSLSSPITLAASGLPIGAAAYFNPPYIPPGTTTNTVTLTITTPSTSAANNSPPGRILPLSATVAILFLPFLTLTRRLNIRPTLLTLAFAMLASAFCLGCGDRINTATKSTTPLQTYTIAVTATATDPTGATLQHTANVTLQVQ